MEVEDERHFLLKCKLYDDLGEEFKDEVSEEEFTRRGLQIMLGEGSREEVKQTIIYLKREMARRRRALELKG